MQNNFKVEIIEECANKDLNNRESYWIKTMQSHQSFGHGYNLTWGGNGVIKYSDEQILSLWDKGLTPLEISEKIGINYNCLLKRLRVLRPEEAKNRYFNTRKTPILQYSLDGVLLKEYSSITEASNQLKIDSGVITRCCKKERTCACGYLWKYKTDLTNIEDLMLQYAKSNKCCNVLMINKETNEVIKEYPTCAAAEKELNIAHGKISEVCNNKNGRKTAGGYKWKWAYELKRRLTENEIK